MFDFSGPISPTLERIVGGDQFALAARIALIHDALCELAGRIEKLEAAAKPRRKRRAKR